jgi:hypothetical protein
MISTGNFDEPYLHELCSSDAVTDYTAACSIFSYENAVVLFVSQLQLPNLDLQVFLRNLAETRLSKRLVRFDSIRPLSSCASDLLLCACVVCASLRHTNECACSPPSPCVIPVEWSDPSASRPPADAHLSDRSGKGRGAHAVDSHQRT